ncbi:MAG TPA: hypothetical protein DCP08_07305 [Chloroflexi bacterium]|nr:hypothetical protein [Chloroflexota bacterium]
MIATLIGASVPNAFLVNPKMRSKASLQVRTLSMASTPGLSSLPSGSCKEDPVGSGTGRDRARQDRPPLAYGD